jgi:hypothetical protein
VVGGIQHLWCEGWRGRVVMGDGKSGGSGGKHKYPLIALKQVFLRFISLIRPFFDLLTGLFDILVPVEPSPNHQAGGPSPVPLQTTTVDCYRTSHSTLPQCIEPPHLKVSPNSNYGSHKTQP